MKVIENFYSIQGEPQSIGKPAYFIRFGGCTLKCKFCDTKYHSNKKNLRELSLLSLVTDIKQYPTKLIVFTGGEPLLKKEEIFDISIYLTGYRFEIETNGTIEPFSFHELGLTNDIQYNVSPKLSSSGNKLENRYKPEILRKFLKEKAIFKFVISNYVDWDEMKYIVNILDIPKERIYIMPNSVTVKQWKKNSLDLIKEIKEEGYSLAPRLQIFLWGKKKNK